MRPNAPHDPAVKSVEEQSDVSPLEVVAPPTQYRVQLLNQLPSLQRHAPLGALAYLIHEPSD
jgi:hypothetical protein